MPIRIEIEAHNAWEAREEMRQLLAGEAPASAAPVSDLAEDTPDTKSREARQAALKEIQDLAEDLEDEAPEQPEEQTPDEPQARLYGQPRPGMKKRNKAEMEEDAEIEKLLGKLHITGDVQPKRADDLLEKLRFEAAKQRDTVAEEEEKSNISTSPEDRKDPSEDAEPKTREDVKAAMQAYVGKHGMDKAMSDLPQIMGYAKQSDIPEDPEAFARVIGAIEEAM